MSITPIRKKNCIFYPPTNFFIIPIKKSLISHRDKTLHIFLLLTFPKRFRKQK